MPLANADDLREDLELSVMELRRAGVAASSIRRFATALKAHDAGEDADGYVATAWLKRRWRQEVA